MSLKYNQDTGEFEYKGIHSENDVYVLCEEVCVDCYDVVAVFSDEDLAISEMKKRRSTSKSRYLIKVRTLNKVDQHFDWTII